MTTSILTQSAAPSRVTALIEFAAAAVAAVIKAIRHRRDVEALARFDDRMLADIGLSRGDLRDAVSEPLWRDPSRVLVARSRERRRGATGRVVPFSVDAPSILPGPTRSTVHSRYY